jgi:hypothetical protein
VELKKCLLGFFVSGIKWEEGLPQLLKRLDIDDLKFLRSFAQMMSESGMNGSDMVFVPGRSRNRCRGLSSGWGRGFRRVGKEVDQNPNHAY